MLDCFLLKSSFDLLKVLHYLNFTKTGMKVILLRYQTVYSISEARLLYIPAFLWDVNKREIFMYGYACSDCNILELMFGTKIDHQKQ